MLNKMINWHVVMAPDTEGSGGGGGGAPPRPTFDDVSRQMSEGVQRALAAGDPNAAMPQPPAGQPAVPAPASTAPSTAGGDPASGTPAHVGQPAGPAGDQRFVTADAFRPLTESVAQMAQATQQLMQQNQVMWQRMTANDPRPADQRPQLPRAMDLARTFIPPDRQSGETDANYAARNQAAMLDHLADGQAAFYKKEIERVADERVAQYRSQVEGQARQAEGARLFESAVDAAVRANGIDPATPQGQFVRNQARANMIAHASQYDLSGSSPQQVQQLLHSSVAAIKQYVAIPTPTGGPPQLTVVPAATGKPTPAPLGGAGGSGPPAIPPSGQEAALTPEEARKPGAFQRVAEQMGKRVQAAIKGA